MVVVHTLVLSLLLLPQDAIPEYGAEQFYGTVSVSAASFAADGNSLLVTSDESGVFNLYRLDLADGARTPLTRSTTSSCFAAAYFPDDDRALFTRDEGGNELDHLYVRELDGTEVDLTPGDRLKAGFLDFTRDGESFFAASNERDPRFMDVYRFAVPPAGRKIGDRPADAYRRTLVFRNDGGFEIGGVSPDGLLLVLALQRNNADDDLYLRELGKPDAEPRLLTAHEGDASHSFACFSADSRTIYYTSDEGGEFASLYAVDVRGGEPSPRCARTGTSPAATIPRTAATGWCRSTPTPGPS